MPIKYKKKKVIKIKINSVQNWLPLEDILEDGIIKLKNKTYVKIIEIIPINYNLKSNLEKEAILNSYKLFLKSCNFNIQILIQSQKEDLSQHIENLEKIKKLENNKLKNIINNYLENIIKLNSNNKSDSKQFFVLINQLPQNKEKINIEQLNEKYLKIREALIRCGNKIINISTKEEVKKILEKSFYLIEDINK